MGCKAEAWAFDCYSRHRSATALRPGLADFSAIFTNFVMQIKNQ